VNIVACEASVVVTALRLVERAPSAASASSVGVFARASP
jgi:hypothetical protein